MQQVSPSGIAALAVAEPHAGRNKRAADGGSDWVGSGFHVFRRARGFCRDRTVTIRGQIGQSASCHYGCGHQPAPRELNRRQQKLSWINVPLRARIQKSAAHSHIYGETDG